MKRFGFPFLAKNHVFFDGFLNQFPSFDFYVILDVFWSVFGSLNIQKSRFNLRKTLFSWICMFQQSYWNYHRFNGFLLIFGASFGVFMLAFRLQFCSLNFSDFLVPKWVPKWTPKLTPKQRKTRAKPDSVPGPSRGGFWGRFRSILGVVLGPFLGAF